MTALFTLLMVVALTCLVHGSDVVLAASGEEVPQSDTAEAHDGPSSAVGVGEGVVMQRRRRADDRGPLEAVVQQQAQELSALTAQLQAANTKLTQLSNGLSERGSTFIRWGRTVCPSHSDMVYTGVAGGALKTHSGAGANRLCMTLTPHYDGLDRPVHYGYLYGAEYQFVPGHEHQDVPCSLCRTHYSTTIMVPATTLCPDGWVAQYTGYLATGYSGDAAASEFVCLDGQAENMLHGGSSDGGNTFYYTVTKCGVLPCPPYVDEKVATCVVCSK